MTGVTAASFICYQIFGDIGNLVAFHREKIEADNIVSLIKKSHLKFIHRKECYVKLDDQVLMLAI